MTTTSPITDLALADAMHPGVVTCLPDDSVAKLASIMVAHGIHAVVLAWGNGAEPPIVTDLELIRAAVEQPDARAAQISCEPVATVPSDAALDQAVGTMAERYVGHLLVLDTDSGDPAGILSSFDVAAVLGGEDPRYARMLRPGPARPSVSARTLRHTRAGDAMHPGVTTCPGDAPLATVARTMAAHRVHCVVLTGIADPAQRRTWGLIGAMDLVVAMHQGMPTASAAKIGATEPISVEEDASLEHVAALMIEHDTSHVVVLDPSGLPTGMVSTRDLASVLAASA